MRSPAEVARGVLAALVDGRVADVLALTDPEVVCLPLTRPGLVVYEGHGGMAALVSDMRAAWGPIQLAVEVAAVEPAAESGTGDAVRVVLRIRGQAADGQVTGQPFLAEFLVRNGLVTMMQSSAEP